MDTATMEKEMRQIGKSMRRNIERHVDEFLSWLIIYSDEDSELIKMMKAPKEEQQQFLEDLQKATSRHKPQKAVIQKLVTKSKVAKAQELFDDIISKSWSPSSGKPGVVPEGFAKHEQLKDLKKKKKKRGKKRGST